MPYRNGVAYYGAYGGGDNTASQARNPTTSRQLSESTQKLFDAINDGNLKDFKQALEGGADVNAFDEEGMIPLMSIVTNLSASSETEKEYQNMIRLLLLHQGIDVNICEKGSDNTAVHLAMCFQQREALRLLLSHPDIKTYLTNKEQQNPNGCAKQNRAEYLITEIQKARKGRELLDALSSGSIYQAKRLLNQELNPNCWKRTQDGRIKTPLSLIIQSCLRTITEDKKEVLTKLLKHKDLDFSYEQYAQLKQTIEQAITERLADAINRKDLDDVKKIVDDNCFMNHTIVAAALRDVNNPIGSITNYLNEKFPANTHNIPKGFEGFKEQELTNKTGKISQLERDLKQVREERDRLSSENRLLRTKSLSNKNEKSSQAISLGRNLSNYTSACFILLGVYAVGACLVIEDSPEMSAFFAAFALVLLVVGCCSLYKANTILSDVESTQLGGLERS